MNVTWLSSQLWLAGGRIWLGRAHAFSMVGGRREVAREHPGKLGLDKNIPGKLLG